jgi:hypothetical protein
VDAAKPERFGEFGDDMAELSGGQRAIRPATARTPLPLRSPSAYRRLLTNPIESVNSTPGPCGTRADSTDCRSRQKSAEGPPRERVEAAQPVASARPAPQQTPSVYGFKVLPASCWSGGAARWRWWRAGQDIPCK